VVKDKKYYDFLDEAIKRNENGESWTSIATSYVQTFGEYITRSAMRHRAQDYSRSKAKKQNSLSKTTITSTLGASTYIQYNNDGTVEESRLISCEDDVTRDPYKLLEALGYDPTKWELVTYRVSKWNSGTEGKELKAVQYKVRPRTDISLTDMVKAAREAFKEELTPFLFTQERNVDGLNDDRLMEIAPIELHIGKMANKIETGENYDLKIAKKRFFDIFEEIYHKQEIEKCGRCVVIIGSDFFNSESDNCTSKDKVPQQNDTRYIKLFHEGIKMYVQALLTLRGLFNKVDVMLCAGNHARAMETFLYMALEQRFVNDEVVHFIENYRLTQVYQFGKCAIFYNHGDANLKQTIASIPAEFDEVWGTHPYRELHLGHLHKEVTVDENGGMITRRIGSPCGTDAWHYSNRFVGAIKKHQIFIWDKNSGLRDLYYITVKDN
jgi:hypothetical protein